MRWFKHGPGTHQLPSRMEFFCHLLNPYPVTVRIHIKPPYFLDLWPRLHLSVIPLFLLSFYLPSVSTLFPSSVILDGDLLAPQYGPGVWQFWISVFFSSTVIFLIPLYLVLFCVSWIATDNETGSPSDVLGASLALCGTIIYILNFYPRSLLTKALFFFIIEALIVCRNGNEKLVFHATPALKVMETVTSCPFNVKGFL